MKERFPKKRFTKKNFHFPKPNEKLGHAFHDDGLFSKNNDTLKLSGKNAILSYLVQYERGHGTHSIDGACLDILGDEQKAFDEKTKKIIKMAQSLGMRVKFHAVKSQSAKLFDLIEKHQGLMLSTSYPKVFDFDDVKDELKSLQSNVSSCQLVILDHIHDPRNFGAILRTCAFFGVTYVVFPKDRQAQISATVVQASEGGVFEVKLISAVNLSRVLTFLKDFGFWVIAAQTRAGCQDLKSVPKDRPYALVLGNEARGVGREIMKKSDYFVKIPGNSLSLDSLNVSVSAGIFFYYLTSK